MTKSEAKKYRRLLDAELEYEAEVYRRSLEGAAWHRANGDAKRAKVLEDRARVVLDEAMGDVAEAKASVQDEPMLTLQDLHRAERIAARRGAGRGSRARWWRAARASRSARHTERCVASN